MGKILNDFWVQNISLYYVPEAVSAETAAFYGDPFCRYLFAINGTSLNSKSETMLTDVKAEINIYSRAQNDLGP